MNTTQTTITFTEHWTTNGQVRDYNDNKIVGIEYNNYKTQIEGTEYYLYLEVATIHSSPSRIVITSYILDESEDAIAYACVSASHQNTTFIANDFAEMLDATYSNSGAKSLNDRTLYNIINELTK